MTMYDNEREALKVVGQSFSAEEFALRMRRKDLEIAQVERWLAGEEEPCWDDFEELLRAAGCTVQNDVKWLGDQPASSSAPVEV
jgi:hypothetical protein